MEKTIIIQENENIDIECKYGFYTCENKIKLFCETCEEGDNYEYNYNIK
jgi:hypothetical protein